jgi:hypothetical protein
VLKFVTPTHPVPDRLVLKEGTDWSGRSRQTAQKHVAYVDVIDNEIGQRSRICNRVPLWDPPVGIAKVARQLSVCLPMMYANHSRTTIRQPARDEERR